MRIKQHRIATPLISNPSPTPLSRFLPPLLPLSSPIRNPAHHHHHPCRRSPSSLIQPHLTSSHSHHPQPSPATIQPKIIYLVHVRFLSRLNPRIKCNVILKASAIIDIDTKDNNNLSSQSRSFSLTSLQPHSTQSNSIQLNST